MNIKAVEAIEIDEMGTGQCIGCILSTLPICPESTRLACEHETDKDCVTEAVIYVVDVEVYE